MCREPQVHNISFEVFSSSFPPVKTLGATAAALIYLLPGEIMGPFSLRPLLLAT